MRSNGTFTFEQPYRTIEARVINWIGNAARSVGRRPAMTVDDILDSAWEQVDVTCGWQDGSFLEPLRRLLDSFEREAELTPFGRLILKGGYAHLAANRLRIEQEARQCPETLEHPVRRPIFVVGLPRTGTTLLYNLLSQDPESRPLRTWEAFYPSPSPKRARRIDSRMLKVGLSLGLFNRQAPRLRSVHEIDPTGSEECTWLLGNSFVSCGPSLQGRIPGYMAWYRGLPEIEYRRAHEFCRTQLQLMQRTSPERRWVLKSPVLLPTLDALLKVFPDACVIQTHRDPCKVVPSACSLFAVTRGIYSDRVDLPQLGEEVASLLVWFLERALRTRQAHPERMIDVQFGELVREPIETVRRIYHHFGRECSPQMEANMQRWLAEHPQHKFGKHRYQPEQFGLSAEVLERLFGGYRDRFQIESEAQPAG